MSRALQVDVFADTLDAMMDREGRGQHAVHGALALSGKLRGEHVRTQRVDGDVQATATVLTADSASIGGGAAVVRTLAASAAHRRTKCDHYAYVPFQRANRHDPCVLEIKQLLLVRCPGLGWRRDTARIAAGTLYHATILAGPGLEQSYNDDPRQGACRVPTILRVSGSALENGYPWAVHVHQINSPVIALPGSGNAKDFVTFAKLGFHGAL